MTQPLEYETPRPAQKRPFWLTRRERIRMAVWLSVFLGWSLTGDWLKSLGWQWWHRDLLLVAMALAAVLALRLTVGREP